VVQCVAVWYSVLQCGTVCCSVVQCVAVWYSVLQCGTVCCSVMQRFTVCCIVLQYVYRGARVGAHRVLEALLDITQIWNKSQKST